MRAVVVRRFGGPEVLEVAELPDPLPGRGQVVVDVRAVGVNSIDLRIRSGTSGLPARLPHVLGMEVAGVISAVGADTRGWSVGDRVAPRFQVTCRTCPACVGGSSQHCTRLRQRGIHLPGGYAERVVADARDLIRLPEDLDWPQAASVQTTYATAWHALVTRGGLRRGETVLIPSAGGGLASAAVQVARLVGATVVATVGASWKAERARSVGAHHVIHHREQDLRRRVLDVTSGRGVDVVLEHVGGSSFASALDVTATTGRVLVCGAHGDSRADIDLVELFRREHEVIGCARSTPDETHAVIDLVAAGDLSPVVDHVLHLEQAAEAHRLLQDREVFGQVVLTP